METCFQLSPIPHPEGTTGKSHTSPLCAHKTLPPHLQQDLTGLLPSPASIPKSHLGITCDSADVSTCAKKALLPLPPSKGTQTVLLGHCYAPSPAHRLNPRTLHPSRPSPCPTTFLQPFRFFIPGVARRSGTKSLNEFQNKNHSTLSTVLPLHLQNPQVKSSRLSWQLVFPALSKL